jgi:hypothetical protein
MLTATYIHRPVPKSPRFRFRNIRLCSYSYSIHVLHFYHIPTPRAAALSSAQLSCSSRCCIKRAANPLRLSYRPRPCFFWGMDNSFAGIGIGWLGCGSKQSLMTLTLTGSSSKYYMYCIYSVYTDKADPMIKREDVVQGLAWCNAHADIDTEDIYILQVGTDKQDLSCKCRCWSVLVLHRYKNTN